MDMYNWDSVEDYAITDSFISGRKKSWKRTLSNISVRLEGSVLDVACGPLSLGAIYDEVVGIDVVPKFVKSVRSKGYKAIISDMRCLKLDDDSFDVVVCVSPPIYPFTQKSLTRKKILNTEGMIDAIVNGMLRVARKKVVIAGCPSSYINHAPKVSKCTYSLDLPRHIIYDL